MKMAFIICCCIFSCTGISGQSLQQHVQSDGQLIQQFNPDKATRELLKSIPASQRDRSDRFGEGRYWLILWNFLYSATTAWIFLFGGLSAKLKKLTNNTYNDNRGTLMYIVLFLMLSFMISLPMDIYENYIRMKEYGLIHQSVIQWFSKALGRFLIELIILTPLLILLYKPFRKTKDNVWAWGVSLSIFLLTAIFKSVQAQGIAHYASLPLLKTLMEFGLLTILGIILIQMTFKKLVTIYGERWGIRNIRQATSLPLLVFLVSCSLFVSTPVTNSIKRRFEMEEDIYHLNNSRDPDAFASSLLKSAQFNKAEPGHWEEFFFFDHPSLKSRIQYIMKWKAEHFVFLPHFNIKNFGC